MDWHTVLLIRNSPKWIYKENERKDKQRGGKRALYRIKYLIKELNIYFCTLERKKKVALWNNDFQIAVHLIVLLLRFYYYDMQDKHLKLLVWSYTQLLFT